MHCINCGKNIPSDSKFCQFCGKNLPTYTASSDVQNNTQTLCQVCGAKAPVKYNEFYANIGMLFTRRQMHIKGNMCKNCINKYFWNYTLTNLFLGWWGIISFFATCFFMLNNIFRYLSSLTLKKYY